MASRKLLVVGATGQQGGALIEALLANKSSFDIYGLTRNKASPSATKLSERGVHMIEGDVSAPLPIFKQLGKGVYGVFSVTTLSKDEEGEAKPLIDAAIANNVQHFVYTSADRGGPAKSDEDPTVVPHFITKFNVEKHLIAKAAKSPQRMIWTILRPVSFMDNFTTNFLGKVMGRIMSNNGAVPIQLISTKDIGRVAARAFEEPERHNGRAITLAGDRLTFAEVNKIFKEEVGHGAPIAPSILVTVALFFQDDLKKMTQWVQDGGYAGDTGYIQKETPGLMDFRTWLRTESKWPTRE
jgi:uncharacterized protein YbjT (DUF2867 family)